MKLKQCDEAIKSLNGNQLFNASKAIAADAFNSSRPSRIILSANN